jgi:D-arabinose 1-dehydrogenase-like Zn-dependent alcohol dehydrogenase
MFQGYSASGPGEELQPFEYEPGHEAIGVIQALGDQIHHLDIGRRVGVGW